MHKKDLAERLAKQTNHTTGEAADGVDAAVHRFLKGLRQGEPARADALKRLIQEANCTPEPERTAGKAMKRSCSAGDVVVAIRQALREGHWVEIEGLGTFRPKSRGFVFTAEVRPRIFIAYIREDLGAAKRLFRDLKRAYYAPWLDSESLLPGQNWSDAIDRAIEISDFFIPCFSKHSVGKRGAFQSELRFAMHCATRLPLDDVFLVPVRLDSCSLPCRIERDLQHVDLFPEWDEGVARILRTVDEAFAQKRQPRNPKAA